MAKPTISFVVPLFNHLVQTQAMVDSLMASLPTGLDYEVVLVDDASSDGTRQWLAGLDHPRIQKLRNPQNQGYARSNNAGVRLARGQVLGLLNNDLLLERGWLEPMLEVLESPLLNAGLVGNVQYRVADGTLDHAGMRLNEGGQFEHVQALPAGGATHQRVLAVTGACMLIRKADFDQVGGFDETFINGCEDVDLSYKLRAVRKFTYVATESRIRHHVSLSRSRSTLQNARNSRHLYGKWRAEIKSEIGRLWVGLLQSKPSAYEKYVHGKLSASFLATPQTAARTMAEALLLREEFHWMRELGEPDPNANVAGRCSVQGLRFVEQDSSYLLEGEAEVVLQGVRSICNFYVCGRQIDDPSLGQLGVTISVNGIQEQTFPLGTALNVNVGMIEPILLQGMSNCFKVRVHLVDAPEQRLGAASKSIALTHFVVDDQMVRIGERFL